MPYTLDEISAEVWSVTDKIAETLPEEERREFYAHVVRELSGGMAVLVDEGVEVRI